MPSEGKSNIDRFRKSIGDQNRTLISIPQICLLIVFLSRLKTVTILELLAYIQATANHKYLHT